MSSCPSCGGAWAISSGSGRVVGAIARSLVDIHALPDAFRSGDIFPDESGKTK